MAVGNNEFSGMQAVNGIRLGTSNAGIRQTVRDDVLIIEMMEGGSCAAVFTRNAFCAAPVHVAKAHLSRTPRWLLVNSGNANAGTGLQGMQDAQQSCRLLADLTGTAMEQVLPFSTGVIGEYLPMDKLAKALPEALHRLNADNWASAARAIMTTDTFPKGASTVISLVGNPVAVTGIAKGAGMIQPDMATMLCFIATDARISQPLLQQCLSQSVDTSFNRITVDGDTSTNDACVILASGRTEAPEIQPDSEEFTVFSAAVQQICQQLAEAIVRDGEGATKLIRIVVEQAASDEEALCVAKTIAHSPLVKTAFFASDPNWGRILAAVGRADVDALQIDKVAIYLGELNIVKGGERAPSYTEVAGQAVMAQKEITVRIVLARGNARQEVLTCDFSYDYVKINAEYRT